MSENYLVVQQQNAPGTMRIHTRGLADVLDYELYVDDVPPEGIKVVEYILHGAARAHLKYQTKFAPTMVLSLRDQISELCSKLSDKPVTGIDPSAKVETRFLLVSPTTCPPAKD